MATAGQLKQVLKLLGNRQRKIMQAVADLAELREQTNKADAAMGDAVALAKARDVLAAQIDRINASTNAGEFSVAARTGWKWDGFEPWIATEGHGGPGPLVSNAAVKVQEKPRQIGNSEAAILYALHHLWKVRKASVAFVLHTFDTAVKMQRERIAPAIEETPIMRLSRIVNNDFTKAFKIAGTKRFLNIFNATSAKARSVAATLDVLDEFQLHPADKYAEIVSGIGFKDQDEWISGTPLAPGGQLTLLRETGCDYKMVYGCPHCGAWNAPEMTIDTATKTPQSSHVAVNPHYDGVTAANARRDQLPCGGCKYPLTPCKHSFKCRELIMVCSACGGSLEHLRGRAGVFADDGVGTRRGAALWVAQRLNPAGKPDLSMCASWQWTRFEIGLYPIARIYQTIGMIIASDPLSGLRTAVNEQIGKPFTGGDGCMVLPAWIDAAKTRHLDTDQARRLEYEVVFASVDWGAEQGLGTHAHIWGLVPYRGGYRIVFLNAHSFAGEHIQQRKDAARWACVEMGAQLALVDAGYDAGGARIFAEYLGDSRVIRIDHSHRAAQTAVDVPYVVVPPEKIGEWRVFPIPKALAFSHMVGVVSQLRTLDDGTSVNERLVIPWRRPEELNKHVVQWFNVFRGKGERFKKSVDGLEIVGDEREGFRKAGPIHSLDCLKFACLILYSPVHTQYFLSLARSGRR